MHSFIANVPKEVIQHYILEAYVHFAIAKKSPLLFYDLRTTPQQLSCLVLLQQPHVNCAAIVIKVVCITFK